MHSLVAGDPACMRVDLPLPEHAPAAWPDLLVSSVPVAVEAMECTHLGRGSPAAEGLKLRPHGSPDSPLTLAQEEASRA